MIYIYIYQYILMIFLGKFYSIKIQFLFPFFKVLQYTVWQWGTNAMPHQNWFWKVVCSNYGSRLLTDLVRIVCFRNWWRIWENVDVLFSKKCKTKEKKRQRKLWIFILVFTQLNQNKIRPQWNMLILSYRIFYCLFWIFE